MSDIITNGKLTIGKFEYDVVEKEMYQADLCFYPENPRIYSILNLVEGLPEQDEIEDILTDMDHVKQLKLSIEANGGLIDPLIVRAGDNVVLEGNSRLAAYRLLAQKDYIKWTKVKCKVLPADIPEKAVFTLLGQYHIIGRKDWSPFEQAGYLYRRTKLSEVSIEYMAKELGLTLSMAKSYINIYTFMVENGDLKQDHWSHYVEYLKNKSIKKYRDTYEGLDEVIVGQIKSEKICQATDIRNKLGGIAKVDGKKAKKIMADISNGILNIYEGFEKIECTGKTGNAFNTLNKFRTKINEDDFLFKLKNGNNTKEITFELNKIRSTIDKYIKELKNEVN